MATEFAKRPPSVLPDISPTWREIDSRVGFRLSSNASIAEMMRKDAKAKRLAPSSERRGLSARLGGLLIILALALAPLPALAVNPDEVLADPALEQRARNLSSQLRCMVCQNQSIDDSNAELARDLRLLVRDRIVKGESDDEVIAYVVSRYGEFVLLNPRLSWRTYALWSSPLLLLAAGGVALFVYSRTGARRRTERLTPEEEARLEKLLGE